MAQNRPILIFGSTLKGHFSAYISVNTHAREILSSGNDSNRKNNSEKLLYMLKNVLLMYFQKSKLAIFDPKLKMFYNLFKRIEAIELSLLPYGY